MSQLLQPERVANSVSRVTTRMLGLTFRPAISTMPIERWRTVALAIPGKRPVTVAISSDRRGCAALASAMLGMAEDDLGVDMIDDFMRELVNMTAGQIKTELSLDQALGLPKIADAEVLFAGDAWTHHLLDANSIALVVSIMPGVI